MTDSFAGLIRSYHRFAKASERVRTAMSRWLDRMWAARLAHRQQRSRRR